MATSILLSALCLSQPKFKIPDIPEEGQAPKPVYDPQPAHKDGGLAPEFAKFTTIKSDEVVGGTGRYHGLAGFLKDSVAFLPKKRVEAGQGFKLACPKEADDGCTYYVTAQQKCDCSKTADGGLTALLSNDKEVTPLGTSGGYYTPSGTKESVPTTTFKIDLPNGGEYTAFLTSPTDSLAVWDGTLYKCTALLSKKCNERSDCFLPKDAGCKTKESSPHKESEGCADFCSGKQEEEL